jgi:mannose/cellobiose epimerase-like protein (N-acyl-D-glucosamine 2-epimerase family)
VGGERLRAYMMHRRPGDDARLTAAVAGLCQFLTTPADGLWFDQLTADDRFVVEPARATSLYHMVGAVAELATAGPSNARGRRFGACVDTARKIRFKPC